MSIATSLNKHLEGTGLKAVRPLSEIARDIRRNWASVNYAAVPYLNAMAQLDTMADRYYEDSAQSVVAYFLSNAATWRGEHAKRIKAELKGMLPKARR